MVPSSLVCSFVVWLLQKNNSIVLHQIHIHGYTDMRTRYVEVGMDVWSMTKTHRQMGNLVSANSGLSRAIANSFPVLLGRPGKVTPCCSLFHTTSCDANKNPSSADCIKKYMLKMTNINSSHQRAWYCFIVTPFTSCIRPEESGC